MSTHNIYFYGELEKIIPDTPNTPPHYENTPIQIYRKFHLKTENFQLKNSIFLISAENIDCGYSLEPPQ